MKEPFYKQDTRNTNPVEKNEDIDTEFLDELDPEEDAIFFRENRINREKDVVRLPEELTSIDNIPYYRKEPGRPRKLKEEKPVVYGTETVAELLGITSQTVRSYCDDFPEFITISKKEKGQRIFTQENIEQLRYVMEIKDKKNLTKNNLKAYLQDPKKYEMTDHEREFEALKQMLNSMMLNMEEHYISMLSDFQKNTFLALEDKNNTTAQLLKDVAEGLNRQEHSILKLSEQLNNQRDDVYTKENQRLVEDIQELKKNFKEELEKKDSVYNELKKEYEKQSLRIQELEKKKKGGILGFFK